MARFLVRVEAVNLSATVYDTNDLSTIRGAGVACLELPGAILAALTGAIPGSTLTPIFEGASQAAGLLDGETTAEAIEARLEAMIRGQEPIPALASELAAVLPYLSVIGVAIAADGSYRTARLQAIARLRARQLAMPTLDLPVAGSVSARRPCAIDGVRPAVVEDYLGTERVLVSQSVARRRALGRKLRRSLYARLIGDGGKDRTGLPEFAESFADLVTPSPGALVPSMAGKMAVIHLDGNSFTKIREGAIAAAADDASALETERLFSEGVRKAQRGLLTRLVEMLRADDRCLFGPDRRLRFETLLWGGDEAIFVLPAFKVWDVLRFLGKEFDDPSWQVEKTALKLGVGVLVCNHKMPISIARGLVESVLDGAKKALDAAFGKDGRKDHHAVSIQLLESVEPPAGGLGAFRKAVYKTDDPAGFAIFDRVGLVEYLDLVDRLTDPATGLPRSQLYDQISADRKGAAQPAQEPAKEPEEAAKDGAEQVARGVQKAVKRSKAVKERGQDSADRLAADLRHPRLGVAASAPWLGLVRLAEMWDLVRPFAANEPAEAR